jgi:hypothetical protein
MMLLWNRRIPICKTLSVGEVLDPFRDAALELRLPDRSDLETEVAQSTTQVVLDGVAFDCNSLRWVSNIRSFRLRSVITRLRYVSDRIGGIMQKRAVIYVRVSTDKQIVENQTREQRQIAERRGWQAGEEYRDAGMIGAKGRVSRQGLLAN